MGSRLWALEDNTFDNLCTCGIFSITIVSVVVNRTFDLRQQIDGLWFKYNHVMSLTSCCDHSHSTADCLQLRFLECWVGRFLG
mmetsp:Transcript_132956/g.230558  ORF Transcript_132956/g.230558 Transcript_132956/m.230558 type:complete len:83 (-) Transcript_132956:11-259(-)